MMTESVNEKVQAQAYEFWTDLCTEEIERKKTNKGCFDFVIRSQDALVNLVF